MLEDAFTYPTEHESWIKTVLIGGMLTFLGFLLLPLFVVQGYVIRVIRTSIDGAASPPQFDRWGGLLVDGLKAWIIGIVYMLIPLVVAVLTVGGSIGALATGGRVGTAVGVAGMLGGLTVTAVFALVFGYVAVAAIVNFAREERLGAAFDVSQLKALALDRDYAVAWLVSVAVFIVAGLITSIPLIGFVLGPFISFYASVVAARLWAGGYLDAIGNGKQPEVEEGQSVA